MPANLDQPFAESCCDGGEGSGDNSARSCGCDPGAGWLCLLHRAVKHQLEQEVKPIPPSREEVRHTDPVTGGQKGVKLQRFSLIPAEFLWALAEHYGLGAKKYSDNNWLKGYKWSLSYDALQRHIHQWKMGETIDPETGAHHLVAAGWHCCALFIFQLRKLGTDDMRPNEKQD